MDDLFAVVMVMVVIAIPVGSLAYQYLQFEKVKDELYKLVKQSGARNILIEGDWLRGKSDSYRFIVSYTDVSGNRQKRYVSRYVNTHLSYTNGEFLWNQPLVSNHTENLSSRLSSKEQIISDMDAEIRRLQAELRHSQKVF